MMKSKHPVRLKTPRGQTKIFLEPMMPDPRKLILEEAMFARAVIIATGFFILAGFVVWTRISEIEALTRVAASVN
jgi:hypothetical protein